MNRGSAAADGPETSLDVATMTGPVASLAAGGICYGLGAAVHAARDAFQAVLPQGHRLARSGHDVSLTDLADQTWVRRTEHFASLRKPLDPGAFITGLREEMRAELDALHDALPRLDWLQIAGRREGAIKLTPLDAAPEPRNLRLLKKEIAARWGTVPLIDMPYSDRSVRKILTRYTRAAGITASISPHTLRHFLFTWLKTQGIDDALIQPYSGHAARQSLEIYSRLALADAQQRYDDVIGNFPV